MDTHGVRSAGLIPKESHAAIIEQRTNRILATWSPGPDGAYTGYQVELARKEASRLYTGNCQRADANARHHDEPQTKDALFQACDSYDCEAWLETQETFGCIQFEQATSDQLGAVK